MFFVFLIDDCSGWLRDPTPLGLNEEWRDLEVLEDPARVLHGIHSRSTQPNLPLFFSNGLARVMADNDGWSDLRADLNSKVSKFQRESVY